MENKGFYEEAEVVDNPALPLVDLSARFNNLLLHEQKGRKLDWLKADLAKLEYTPEAAVNAAYFYLMGIRRIKDPLDRPMLPKKWPMLLLTVLFAGMGIMYYIFHI